MNLKKYIPDGTRYIHLASAKDVGVARTIFEASEKKRDETVDKIINNPMICNEDIKKDIRYQSGFAAALQWVLDLPGEAKKFIDHLPEKEI